MIFREIANEINRILGARYGIYLNENLSSNWGIPREISPEIVLGSLVVNDGSFRPIARSKGFEASATLYIFAPCNTADLLEIEDDLQRLISVKNGRINYMSTDKDGNAVAEEYTYSWSFGTPKRYSGVETINGVEYLPMDVSLNLVITDSLIFENDTKTYVSKTAFETKTTIQPSAPYIYNPPIPLEPTHNAVYDGYLGQQPLEYYKPKETESEQGQMQQGLYTANLEEYKHFFYKDGAFDTLDYTRFTQYVDKLCDYINACDIWNDNTKVYFEQMQEYELAGALSWQLNGVQGVAEYKDIDKQKAQSLPTGAADNLVCDGILVRDNNLKNLFKDYNENPQQTYYVYRVTNYGVKVGIYTEPHYCFMQKRQNAGTRTQFTTYSVVFTDTPEWFGGDLNV